MLVSCCPPHVTTTIHFSTSSSNTCSHHHARMQWKQAATRGLVYCTLHKLVLSSNSSNCVVLCTQHTTAAALRSVSAHWLCAQ
eukprot:7226-Heterococcus_DN1.PRE.4